MRANRRVQAICANQQIRLDRRCTGGVSMFQSYAHPPVSQGQYLAHARVRLDCSRPEAAHYRFAQDPDQMNARERHLRPAIAGFQSARFAPDQAATAVEEGKLSSGYSLGSIRSKDIQLRQLSHRVGKNIESNSQWTKLRGGLHNAHLAQASRFQTQSCGEAAHASSGNHDIHSSLLFLTPARLADQASVLPSQVKNGTEKSEAAAAASHLIQAYLFAIRFPGKPKVFSAKDRQRMQNGEQGLRRLEQSRRYLICSDF